MARVVSFYYLLIRNITWWKIYKMKIVKNEWESLKNVAWYDTRELLDRFFSREADKNWYAGKSEINELEVGIGICGN